MGATGEPEIYKGTPKLYQGIAMWSYGWEKKKPHSRGTELTLREFYQGSALCLGFNTGTLGSGRGMGGGEKNKLLYIHIWGIFLVLC